MNARKLSFPALKQNTRAIHDDAGTADRPRNAVRTVITGERHDLADLAAGSEEIGAFGYARGYLDDPAFLCEPADDLRPDKTRPAEYGGNFMTLHHNPLFRA